MFSSSPNYTKLKTHLRLAINRLKLIEKKKIELTQKSRKEIADYIGAGKSERAKIRVEHIIREDYMVEAMEIVEMYCDLLLARFGLITQMKELDEGLAEAISSLIWVSPRMQTDIQELKVISDLLTSKYGKPYADGCRSENVATISDKLKHKLSVQSPPKILVEKYLIEIAKNYNVEYEPDPQIMREDNGSDALLIDINNGQPGPPGFIGGYSMPMPQMSQYPQMPQYPPMTENPVAPFNYPTKPSGGNAGGFYIPQQAQRPPAPMTYNILPGADSKDVNGSFLQEAKNNLPPAYDSLSPDDNLMKSNHPKPQPRSNFGADCSNVTSVTFPDLPDMPDLPSVPSNDLFPPHASNSGRDFATAPKDDIDFDDLTRRFEELKKKK